MNQLEIKIDENKGHYSFNHHQHYYETQENKSSTYLAKGKKMNIYQYRICQRM